MRGWVSAVANYSQPVGIGEVMRAYAAGRIEASRDSRFREGEYITGQFGWQDYAAVDPPDGDPARRRSRSAVVDGAGRSGGARLDRLFRPAGCLPAATGRDGRSIDSRGGSWVVRGTDRQDQELPGGRHLRRRRKRRLCLQELDFDAAVNYDVGRLDAGLAQAAPNGVDVYFDNTSGATSDAVLPPG